MGTSWERRMPHAPDRRTQDVVEATRTDQLLANSGKTPKRGTGSAKAPPGFPNLDLARKALRAIAREIAESGGATLDEAAILEEWRQETDMPGHDVVSGHGPGVPDENPWQDTPHWKVGGRDRIHVRIR